MGETLSVLPAGLVGRVDRNFALDVLLDFGAVQPVALPLAADFRRLLRAALDGGRDETRAAMVQIGYFNNGTAAQHQDQVQAMFEVAMAPLVRR